MGDAVQTDHWFDNEERVGGIADLIGTMSLWIGVAIS
jgi:hypothetical protein